MAEITDVSSELPIKILVVKERKTATISGVPHLEKRGGATILEMGNTGLQLLIEDQNGNGHYKIGGDFMPGGFIDPGYIEPMQAAKIFSYGIKHLRLFLNSSKEIDRDKVSTLTSKTNTAFSNFLERTLIEKGHPELFKKTPDSQVEINLKAFLDLPEDDKLIKFIDNLSGRAEGLRFQAQVRA